MILLFNWAIFRFHINFQGCTMSFYLHAFRNSLPANSFVHIDKTSIASTSASARIRSPEIWDPKIHSFNNTTTYRIVCDISHEKSNDIKLILQKIWWLPPEFRCLDFGFVVKVMCKTIGWLESTRSGSPSKWIHYFMRKSLIDAQWVDEIRLFFYH